MLYFLDNFSSTGVNVQRPARPNEECRESSTGKKANGLNENYAREVMELHTLGVDGGYTQQDVTQAAKILTGWTVFPMGAYGNADAIQKLVDNIRGKRVEATRLLFMKVIFCLPPTGMIMTKKLF